MSQNEHLLTEAEAAEVLAVQPSTLCAWRCRGTRDLPFVRCGRAIRYSPRDLEKFVERNRVAVGEDGR